MMVTVNGVTVNGDHISLMTTEPSTYFSFLKCLSQTNLVSGSTDPTDRVFAESRKNIKNGPKFLYVCKKSELIA